MRRTLRPGRARFVTGAVLGAGLVALGVLAVESPSGLAAIWERLRAGVAPVAQGRVVESRFGLCAGPVRITCVVDGDTIWLEGVKIRVADLNTPETGAPQCPAEAALGARATERLVTLLNEGPFEVRPAGARDEDQYGRKLRVLYRDGRSLSEVLIAEGLAHRWEGYRAGWCG